MSKVWWQLQSVKTILTVKQLIEAATEEGPVWKRALNVVSALVERYSLSDKTIAAGLNSHGFERYTGQLEDLLEIFDFEDAISGEFGSVDFYPNATEPMFIRHTNSRDDAHFYVRRDVDLNEFFTEYTWRNRKVAMLARDGGSYWDPKHGFVSAPPVGKYWGRPSVDDVVRQISSASSPDGTRSILIVGTSGLGKSTVARLAAERLYEGRILIVASDVISNVLHQPEQLIASRPNAVIMEDVPLHSSESLLAIYEKLRGKIPLIISTFMDDKAGEEQEGVGADYFPGMRPGRIDRVIRLLPPQQEQVKEILTGYLGYEPPGDMVAACEGWSGAYLRELTLRVQAGEDWKEQIALLERTMEPEGFSRKLRGRKPMTDDELEEL